MSKLMKSMMGSKAIIESLKEWSTPLGALLSEAHLILIYYQPLHEYEDHTATVRKSFGNRTEILVDLLRG